MNSFLPSATDSWSNYYLTNPPMLKRPMSPDNNQLCLPTHELFDFPSSSSASACSLPPSPKQSPQVQPVSIPQPQERSVSPSPPAQKKRAVGERISTKDFVPPDVTGLSKREARLVKNRAAAFLSRQRKREEFENMELRVAELESENAKLLALTKSDNVQEELHSEIERLRRELAAAQERERGLSAELCAKQDLPPVKLESVEPSFSSNPPKSPSSTQFPHKSSASLGLMVLLCALPTLLSMPTQSSIPNSFSIPTALPTSPTSTSFDVNSILQNEYDWSRKPTMELDTNSPASDRPSSTKRLEFTTPDSSALKDLAGLDISFDTSPSEGGKIRVRIHHPSLSAAGLGSATSNPPTSAPPSRAVSPDDGSSQDHLSAPLSTNHGEMWDTESVASDTPSSTSSSYPSSSSSSSVASFSPATPPPPPGNIHDPFLGVGAGDYKFTPSPFSATFPSGISAPIAPSDSNKGLNTMMSSGAFSSGLEYSLAGLNYNYDYDYDYDFNMDSVTRTMGLGLGTDHWAEHQQPQSQQPQQGDAGTRRVRIALKSMPAAATDGGEWEVELC